LTDTNVDTLTKSQKEAFANRLNELQKRLDEIDSITAESRAS